MQPAQPELKIESNLRLESIVLESSVENSKQTEQQESEKQYVKKQREQPTGKLQCMSTMQHFQGRQGMTNDSDQLQFSQ